MLDNISITCTKVVPKADPLHGIPCSRSSHGLSMINNGTRLILYGGEHLARTPLNDDSQSTWAADYNQQSLDCKWQWRLILHNTTGTTPSTTPPPRVGHAQAVFNDSIVFIFGGRAGVAMNEQPMNDLWMLDASGEPGTERWSEIVTEHESPSPRSFHKMICVGNKLFVFGGCGVTGRLADLAMFDVPTQTWTMLGTSSLLKGRGGANLLALNSGTALAVVAGFAGEEMADGHAFDVMKGTWADMPLTLQGLRPRSVCVSGSFPSVGVAVIFGGEVDPSDRGHEGAGGFENDVVILDESTGTFIATKTKSDNENDEPWPETRGWSDATTLDNNDGTGSLFLFGGLSGDDDSPRRLNDLWRIDISKCS